MEAETCADTKPSNKRLYRFAYIVFLLALLPGMAILYAVIYAINCLPIFGFVVLVTAAITFYFQSLLTIGAVIDRDIPAVVALYRVMYTYVSVILFFGITFVLIEKYLPASIIRSDNKTLSLVDPYYFSVMTIATVGYGDMYPSRTFAKFMVTLEVLSGVVLNISLFGIATSFLLDRFRGKS
jgi:hypothetical protein